MGKETVVQRKGADWSFHLPKGHEIRVDREKGSVRLDVLFQGTTYSLDGIEEDAEEVIVKLGEETGRTDGAAGNSELGGYPLPAIQEEFERLRGRWTAVGLPETEFDVWAEGPWSHEDQLRKIRARLREAEANRRARVSPE